MPLISVIIPVYNKVKYIDECINSILNQTLSDIEIILVDDGSTDGSDVKCDHYKAHDDRVVVIHQKNAGVSIARNRGLEIARGKYIGFVDSDDVVELDFYELLINNTIKYSADISICGMQVITPGQIRGKTKGNNPVSIPYVLDHDNAIIAYLKEELSMSANNKIYRSQIIRDIRFEGTINEDILFTSKAFLKSNTAVVQADVMYYYMVRDNSASMAKFSEKYMEIAKVSSAIVEMMPSENPTCLILAKAYDVSANISLLNLLLLTNDARFANYLAAVTNNLARYSHFIKESPHVRKKHRYAYMIFRLSPRIYKALTYLYCVISGADILKRI